MNTTERMSAALRRFEDALQAAGHPLRGLLRPGLSVDTIEELVAPTGLQLPDEATVLWSWRDGIDSTTNTWPAGPAWGERLPGGARLLPLAEAVHVWEENRHNMDWAARTDLSPHWLPLATFGSPGLLWLDCTAAPGEASPVRYVDLWENAPPQLQRERTAPSLAATFDAMSALLEDDRWAIIDNGAGTDESHPAYTWKQEPPRSRWISTWP